MYILYNARGYPETWERRNPQPDESKMVTSSFPFGGILVGPCCYQFLAAYTLFWMIDSAAGEVFLQTKWVAGRLVIASSFDNVWNCSINLTFNIRLWWSYCWLQPSGGSSLLKVMSSTHARTRTLDTYNAELMAYVQVNPTGLFIAVMSS